METYKVVIINRKTKEAVSTIGEKMTEDQACKRQMTALMYRVDVENYDVDVIKEF